MQKLDKTNIEDILALTPMQEGMLFHYLKDPGSDYYFEQLSLEISGKINKEIFEKAWNFVIESNEMLRAVFRWEKVDKPVQIILKGHQFQPRYCDFSEKAANDVQNQLEEIKGKDREQKFDLREVPFRVTLCKTEEKKYEMIISNHHILYDGWSNGIILKEFFNAYANLSLTPGNEGMKPVKTRFKEFLQWILQQDRHKQKNFWSQYLGDFDTPTLLPIKKNRNGETVKEVKNYSIILEKDTVDQLEVFTAGRRLTRASVFYGAWGILLQRYCNSEDVIFGITVSGRPPVIKGIEDMVGLFINTLPLRVQSHDSTTVIELLLQLDRDLQERERFEHTPLVEINQSSAVPGGTLFDTLFVIENYPIGQRLASENGSLNINRYSAVEKTHYDLTVSLELSEGIKITFAYRPRTVAGESVVALGGHFREIVKKIAANPGQRVHRLEIIPEQEKKQILLDFNDTAANYPLDKMIHHLFEGQVDHGPDRIAAVGPLIQTAAQICNDGSNTGPITYNQLNRKANQLAYGLKEKGVGPDTIVGIMIERSVEMIIGILGILKAGAAYMPIDPDYPQERIDYMLKDSGAKLLVTTGNLAKESEKVRRWEGEKILLDVEERHAYPVDHLDISPPQATSLAYIIYTSGSTGKPKGIMIEHRSVINFIKGITDVIPFKESDRILSLTTIAFDIFGLETLVPFSQGSGVVLGSREEQLDTAAASLIIQRENISIFQVTPTRLQMMISFPGTEASLGLLEFLLVGGESFPGSLLEKVRVLMHGKIYNMYGPTETTIWSTLKDLSGNEALNIGKPIANTLIYIVDNVGKLQPIEIVGELCIGGDGLARGYLNNPGLTKDKFKIKNGTFGAREAHELHELKIRDQEPGSLAPYQSKFYKTGDLARWLTDGNIEFLGRIDHQVKIRGFRIELGEIESRLSNKEGIKDAVVLAREDESGDKYLSAYVVSERKIIVSEIREYLSKELPDYMIPSYFVRLEKMPLTPSGKVDRRALPLPELKASESYIAPGDEIEKKLAEIWSGVLGIEKEEISINDNFFHLGGHSLKATILLSRIHKELKVNVPLPVIFKTSHIRGLAAFIKNAETQRFFSIKTVEKKEYYILSSAQRRLSVLQQMDEQGTGYNIPSVWQLEGEIDVEKFAVVFHGLIQRHESLRTSFHVVDNEPVQRIHDKVEFQVENYQLQIQRYWGNGMVPSGQIHAFGEDTSLTQTRDTSTIIKDFLRPFDLSRAPLFRVRLIEQEEQKNILMVDMHHIISDGMSIGVFVREFMEFYAGKSLPVLRLQYKDYSEWHHRQALEKPIKQQETYWLKEFAGDIPVLGLPTDYPRPPVQNFAGSSIPFEIGGEETNAIKSLANEQGVTLFMLLLSLYTACLSRLCGQEDIVVGTPIAGRRHADLELLMGMFVNTLALRNFPDGQKPFIQFLEEVKENTVKAFENQDYLYENLVEKVDLERDTGRNPLFDTMFAMQNFDALKIKIPGLKVQPLDYETNISKFDLALTAVERGECLLFIFEYSTKLFKQETIQRFIGNFTKTISTIIDNHDIRILEIEIIGEEEKNRILHEFNDTDADYPKEKTIHRLFEEQVEKRPYKVALVGAEGGERKRRREEEKMEEDSFERIDARGGMHLSYRELNERSGKLAVLLIEKGIKPDTIVGIMVKRSVEMIVGILGILKSGGAYLPIDPDYPQERIDYMLKDSEAKLLVTTGNLAKEGEKILLEEILEVPKCNDYPLTLLRSYPQSSSNLAYVIFTSGTTGKPKGVILEHRSVVNYACWAAKQYVKGENVNFPLYTSITFDLTVTSLFVPLITGNSIIVYRGEEGETPINTFERIIRDERIGVVKLTPAHLKIVKEMQLESKSRIKRLILGGENLEIRLSDEIHKKFDGKLEIYNEYGPTEATVGCMIHLFDPGRDRRPSVPIGVPADNLRIFILNKFLKPVPIGVTGELFISGAGLARGYLNQPELTAERFCLWRPGTFLKKISWTSKNFSLYHSPITTHRSRIYQTGDLARRFPDGNIEFLGRIDNQVKIRGFRIELGEIDNRLSNHPGIKEVVVLAREDEPGDKYLCAYIVSDREYGISELRESLLKELPEYMIPAYFTWLEKMPVTPSGKIDRKALPVPVLKASDNYEAPRDGIEKKLVEIWSGVLGIEKEKISINDNFFHLGGHSLKATVLVSRIHKELKVNVPLPEIFKTSHIRGLAAFIKNAETQRFFSIEAVEKKEYYILSSTQRRLLVLQQMDEKGIAYNMPSEWQLEGDIDGEKFAAVFQQLIRRHESLRTSFHMVNDEPMQRIHDEVKFKIEYYNFTTDYTDYKEDTKNIEGISKVFGSPEPFFQKGFWPPEAIIKDFIRPFDLTRAPLFRVGLLEQEEQKNILMVDMHHIISDGISTGIFVKEFMELYAGKEPPASRLQYKDYSEWHKRQTLEKPIRQQEAYWLKEFAGETPVLEVPTDYPRPPVQDFAGGTLHFDLNKEETAALKSLAREQNFTLFMLLLSIYNIFLCKISGQEDIVVGTPIAGRRHTDLESIIGMFVNTLALRNFPVREKTFGQFLKEVGENTLKAFENQDYLYEYLVEEVVIERDASRNPLFDTMFTLQNTGSQKIEIPGMKLSPYQYENKTAKFDLELSGIEVANNMLFTFEYCSKLFKRETIDRFIGYFKKIIGGVLQGKHRKLSDIEIISEEERKLILFDFNDTKTEYQKDKTIHRLFEEQVEKTPDSISLVGVGEQGAFLKNRPLAPQKTFYCLNYRELNDRSNRLAYLLIEKGVLSDNIIGIMMERSVEMVIVILGILKAGGAYLPIDPNYPQERIDYMLKDSCAKLLATVPGLSEKFEKLLIVNCQLLMVNEIPPNRPGLNNPPKETNSISNYQLTINHLQLEQASLAYIIYTSGSTGKPKAALVEHSGMMNHLHIKIDDLKIDDESIVAQTASHTFDISVWQFFSALAVGGKTVIYPQSLLLEPDMFISRVIRDLITIMEVVPSYLNILFDSIERLVRASLPVKYLLVTGEEVKPYLVKKFFRLFPGVKMVNAYGPTEASDDITHYIMDNTPDIEPIPIGRPLQNLKIYIVDEHMNLCPIGIKGEICVSGVGVGRGYLNDEASTRQVFMEDPFREEKRVRLYKTGDLGCWLPDGIIEFWGRKDYQVKIKGFRIECGEIENRLLEIPNIAEVVVIDRDDMQGNKYLCAYMVTNSNLSISGIKTQLSVGLPDYMIPSYFMQLEKIPLTVNGKVDRRALPEPELDAGEDYVGPRDEIEKKLVNIWHEVLNIPYDNIGINDNFFELGGHSLNATTIGVKIHKQLNVHVPLAEIFKRSMIRGLAEYIRGTLKEKYESILPAEEKEYYILSSAQKQMYILQQLDWEGTTYNMPLITSLRVDSDFVRIKNALKKLIKRHENFRTSFQMINNEEVQKIHEEVDFELEYFDFKTTKDEIKGTVDGIIKNFIRPFDLSHPPLLRAGFIKAGENQSFFIVDMHHIISDGISHSVLIKDFAALYNGKEPNPLRIRYKDYSEWQQSREVQNSLMNQEEYWLREFGGDIPVLNLSTDFERPFIQSFEGRTVSFNLTQGETRMLKKIALEEGATMFMVFLAIYSILLSRLSIQDVLVVGTSIAGRPHNDLEGVVGMFVNSLALKITLEKGKTFKEFLRSVKDKTLQAFDNQDYQFDDLVGRLTPIRVQGRNPLFDVRLTMDNIEPTPPDIPELAIRPYEYANNVSKFDMTLLIVDNDDTLNGSIIYCSKLFKEETIIQFVDFIKEIVQQVLEKSDIKLEGIKLTHGFTIVQNDIEGIDLNF